MLPRTAKCTVLGANSSKEAADKIKDEDLEDGERPPPKSAGMSTGSPLGLALSASAMKGGSHTTWQKGGSILASLERARPAQDASRPLSGLASEEQRLAVQVPAEIYTIPPIRQASETQPIAVYTSPPSLSQALGDLFNPPSLSHLLGNLREDETSELLRAEAKATRPTSLNEHEAAWSGALPFFFAAMLEHRAEEYENFNVPKKEKWDRIVKQVLQGLPGRKRRKLVKGGYPDQGTLNTAEEQRRTEQETDRMIQRWNLRVEAEQTAGTGVPNYVLISIDGRNKPGGRGGTSGMSGGGGGAKAAPKAAAAPAAGAPAKTVGEWQEIHDETYNAPYWWNVNTGGTTWEKPAALCRHRRYVHQGEVFGVLMGFLREQPTLPNLPLRLRHAGESLKDIQRKVEAIYCNITDEVIKDLFRALDLCYYLFDIPRPAGSITFESHPDLKPVKKLDFLRAYLEQPFKSKLNSLNRSTLKALLKHGAAVRRSALATPGMQQGVATRHVCEPSEVTCVNKLSQAVGASYVPSAGFDSEPLNLSGDAEKHRLYHAVSLFLGSALRLGGRWAKFEKQAIAKLELLQKRLTKLEKQGEHRLAGGNEAAQGAAPRGPVQVKSEGCRWTGSSNAASTASSSDTRSSELSSLPAKPTRQRRPPPKKPTEQWPQPMQRAAPMYHYAHPSAGSMPVGMWGPQQMHMVAPPPGVGPRGMPAFVTLMPGPSRDGVARCEQTKDCAGWPMAPPNTVGQSAPPC